MRKLAYIIGILFLAASCSTLNVRPVDLNSSQTKKSGFFYNLPKTVITVDVSVEKTYKIKGPYASFADKFLGLKNVVAMNSTSYEISDVKMNSYSSPDAKCYYFVETGKSGKNKNALQMQFSESGFLVNCNYEGIEYNEQYTGNSGQNSFLTDDDINANFSINFNMIEKIDTLIEKVILDTTTIEKKILKKVMVEKTLEQKAKEAADFIMSIKESKYNLLNGMNEVNYSMDVIKYMVEELEKTEQDYLNLFTGISATQTFHYYYTFCPETSGESAEKILARFSVSEGMLDTTRFIGKDLVLQIKKSNDTKDIVNFLSQNSDSKRKLHGFYYRIPEYAEVIVKLHNEELTRARFLINQFGAIAEIPYSKGMKLNFYPKSGALKMMNAK